MTSAPFKLQRMPRDACGTCGHERQMIGRARDRPQISYWPRLANDVRDKSERLCEPRTSKFRVKPRMLRQSTLVNLNRGVIAMAPAPQPLFILSPPRSFSSVVCAMLGQHPQCYGLPELQLFFGDTLGDLENPNFLDQTIRSGLLRAFAQLHDGEQTEDSVIRARQWMKGRSNWPVRKVFDHIQELVGPRILVEKSPATTFRRDYLGRLLRTFPNAHLLHLIRHPRATGESVMSLRAAHEALQRVANARQNITKWDPERTWRVCHTIAVTVTNDLPLGQCMRLKGEAMLSNLEFYLPQVCEWLGIRADAEAVEAMMHPENSPYAKPGPRSAQFGNDPNFLENPAIDRERLAKLKEPRLAGELSWRPGEMFTPETLRLARQFGYQ